MGIVNHDRNLWAYTLELEGNVSVLVRNAHFVAISGCRTWSDNEAEPSEKADRGHLARFNQQRRPIPFPITSQAMDQASIFQKIPN